MRFGYFHLNDDDDDDERKSGMVWHYIYMYISTWSSIDLFYYFKLNESTLKFFSWVVTMYIIVFLVWDRKKERERENKDGTWL